MARFTCVALVAGVLSVLGTTHYALAGEGVPQHHRASLRIVEVDAQGKSNVLASPSIVIGDGQAGMIEISEPGGMSIKVKLTALPQTKPTQYMTEFTLSKGKTILSAPKIMTSSGNRGMVTIGNVGGQRTEYSVIATEIPAVEE